MKALSKMQVWTTPLWLVLMVIPFGYLVATNPDSVGEFFAYTGADGSGSTVSVASVLLAAGVCLSLIAQIAEQIDYLRFMPPRTAENTRQWWTAVVLAGPGWVVFGALKQAVGLFLAVYLIARLDGQAAANANEPVHQFLGVYEQMVPGWLAMTLAVVLVVISQLKINVTNAYSGSLAWTNSFTRVTKHYPGRIVFVVVNLAIALTLMEANMFDFLNTILGFYANCAMAWVITVATDIVVNKHLLGISRRSRVPSRDAVPGEPRGFVSVLLSAGLSIVVFFGGFGAGVLPALLPRRGRRAGRRLPARAGAGHPGALLPAPHRRRPGPADARRGRQPVGRRRHVSRLPPGLRASRRHGLPHPRRRRLLAVPEHRLGGRPRPAGGRRRPAPR